MISSSSNEARRTQHHSHHQHQNYKRLAYEQQQQQHLAKIENEINRVYSFYVQTLNERRDSLVKELQAIVHFVLKQNKTKLTGDEDVGAVGAKGKNSASTKTSNEHDFSENDHFFHATHNGDAEEGESNSNERQLLINNHLMSIEFVSNLANFQSLVRNSFGYIR